jgi:hypothetical protein
LTNLLILHGGRTIGPYTPDETRSYLDSGHLTDTTPAWTEGLPDWSTVSAVLALLRERASRPAPDTPEFTDIATRHLVPDGVRGFCWGALLGTPIWAIGNRVWIGLLAIIPGLGQLVSLWLGFNGRELAWRRGGWRDVPHFIRVQRLWSQIMLGMWVVMLSAGAVLYNIIQQQEPPPQPQPKQQEEPAPAPPSGTGKTEQLTLPMSRADFERVFKGRKMAEVRAAMGPPDVQREDKAKNIVVHGYRKTTLQPGTKTADSLSMLLYANGVVAEFHYAEEKNP